MGNPHDNKFDTVNMEGDRWVVESFLALKILLEIWGNEDIFMFDSLGEWMRKQKVLMR